MLLMNLLTGDPEREFAQIMDVLLGTGESNIKQFETGDFRTRLYGDCLCIFNDQQQIRGEMLDLLKTVLSADSEKTTKKPIAEQIKRILVIAPDLVDTDAIRSATTTWGEQLREIFQAKRPKRKKSRSPEFVPELVIWGNPQLHERLLQCPPLALRYYPDDLPDGPTRRQKIKASRLHYDQQFRSLYGKIQFVGMSVYKEEATGGVEMEHIYIPLRVIGEAADDADPQTPRTDPLRLLAAGERHVILGDPGSGKSTLLKFLALIGTSERLRKRFGSQVDDRLPVLVILRQYADALKAKSELDLLDYVVQTAAHDFELPALNREFFEYHLYAGKALLLFDGVDELPGADFKLKVRQRIGEFLRKYPGNTTIVTSRIVGYETEIRYDSLDFSHHRVARLSLEDIEEFVANVTV